MKKYIRSERVNLFEPNDYIAMIVKLSGKLPVREMQKAVYAAFDANEATMSRVVLEPDGTAYFEKTETTGCRFFDATLPWEKLLQNSERACFRLNEGELVRIFLTEEAGQQVLLIHAHHLVGDGKSILILLQDIISALSDPVLAYKPMTIIDRMLLDKKAKLPLLTKLYIASLNRKWKKQAKVFTWDDYYAIHRKYWDEYASDIQFRSCDLDEIQEKCPENVSINSYLIAQLLQEYPQCKVIGLPVSIREDNAMSNQVTGIVVNYRYDPQKPMEYNTGRIHRSIYKTLGSPLWKYFVLQFTQRLSPTLIDAVLMQSHGCFENDFAAKTANIMGYAGNRSRDLGVTNLGRIDIPSVHEKCVIHDILFVPPKVSYAKQVVGISTYGSKLTISFHNMKKRPVA